MTTPADNAKDELIAQRNRDTTPLPCRGCTADCPNFPACEGMPWRALPAQSSAGV